MNKENERALFERVAVIGLGYIGLPTAAILASRKVNVLGVDINQYAVDMINQGKVHIVEPELDILVQASVNQGFLRAVTQPEPADAFIIAVPTPIDEEKNPDLTYIDTAICSIAPMLKAGNLIILESTSPVGTTEWLAETLHKLRPDLKTCLHSALPDLNIAYCPERVLPGRVIHELVTNDRIIGGLSSACSLKAKSLYKLFVDGECILTSTRTAEMCKLTENSYRDVNIAFANELSILCDEHNIDVQELIYYANRHPRVNILRPGAGVGGHCIAVDPWFIVSRSPQTAKLISTARQVNDNKPEWVVGHILAQIQKLVEKRKVNTNELCIAFLGLTFKPNIDDMRHSPALEIVCELAKNPIGHILVCEPNIHHLPGQLLGQVELASMEKILKEADLVIRLVNHREFSSLELAQNQEFIAY